MESEDMTVENRKRKSSQGSSKSNIIVSNKRPRLESIIQALDLCVARLKGIASAEAVIPLKRRKRSQRIVIRKKQLAMVEVSNQVRNDINKNCERVLSSEANIGELNLENQSENCVATTSSCQNEQDVRCPVCLKRLNFEEISSTICGHVFCTKCIKTAIKLLKYCPACRKRLTVSQVHPLYM